MAGALSYRDYSPTVTYVLAQRSQSVAEISGRHAEQLPYRSADAGLGAAGGHEIRSYKQPAFSVRQSVPKTATDKHGRTQMRSGSVCRPAERGPQGHPGRADARQEEPRFGSSEGFFLPGIDSSGHPRVARVAAGRPVFIRGEIYLGPASADASGKLSVSRSLRPLREVRP